MSSSGGSHTPAIPRRRKHRNSTVAAVLRRRNGILDAPLFQCNLRKKKNSAFAGISSPVNFRHGFPKRELSARKLAAGLWQLRSMELSGKGGASIVDGSFCSSKSDLANENLTIKPLTDHETRDKLEKTKYLPRRPLTILRSRDGIRCQLESSLACLKCCKEGATKWDPGLSEASNEFTQIHSSKHNEERKRMGGSIVSGLLAELLRAQRCINKLKAARKSAKKKVEQFVQKFEEEKIFWKQRELRKMQAMLDDMKDKLGRERRSRERMELMNAKLVHELAEANLSAKNFMKSYEEEKRARELMEEVCNELAKQIGEDKGRLEKLERESMKIREEVEEERKMMQIAELWREERVQMKLVDAKLALEDKYNQMMQLVAYLQSFLRSGGTSEVDGNQSIVELSYDFLKFDDIFAIYEELRKDEGYERVIKAYEDGLDNHSKLHQSSSSSDYNNGLEVGNVIQEDNIVGSEAECSENTYLESPETEITKVLKRKASSGSKLRPCMGKGTTGAIIGGVISACEGSGGEGSFRYRESEAMNPHITRGMKGCIEWPRGIPKSNLKATSLNARVRSQKSQLQHMLKPKA